MTNPAHSKIVKGEYQITSYDWGLRIETLESRAEPLRLDRVYLAALGYTFAGLNRADGAGAEWLDADLPESSITIDGAIETLERDLERARHTLVELKRARQHGCEHEESQGRRVRADA